jgi:hypothetical protein
MISPLGSSRLTQSNMAETTGPYLDTVRSDVDAFVADNFHRKGTTKLHRAALGWDVLRAPVNVILSPLLILIRSSAWICTLLGLKNGAHWLGSRRILLRTAVAGRVETHLVRDLLRVPLPIGQAHDGPTLSHAISEAPQLRAIFRSKSGVAEVNSTVDSIATAIAEYSSSRSAVADITTAIIALFIGAMVFQAVTPGMISMAPGLAKTIALETAVADFPLGQTVGSVWYSVFSTSVSPLLVAGNVAGLVMVGSVIGAFAGILADPVQARLGLHRRRLLRLLDAIEDHLIGSGSKRYSAHEHFYARFLDIWDATVSALRFFRS